MNERQFWAQIRRGLLTIVSAIEYRHGFPRTSGPANVTTLGAHPGTPYAAPHEEATHHTEPPALPLAPTSEVERE